MRFIWFFIATLVGATGMHSMSAEETIEYQPGFDPATARPAGMREIPESAWGREKDGLQAAVTGPEEVRYNERSRFFFVVRNVSDDPVKVTLRSLASHPYITAEGEPPATGGYSNHNGFSRFRINPGHHIAIPFPVITIVRGDGISPIHAKRDLEPGRRFITTGLGAGGENWGVFKPGEKVERIEYPAGEWQGHLKTRPYSFFLLDEEIPLEIPAPREFGEGHSLEPVIEQPKGIDFEGPKFEFRQGLKLHLNRTEDAHWFLEYYGYDRHVFWGPFSAEKLRAQNLLEPIRNQMLAHLQGSEEGVNSGLWEMRRLAVLQKPIVEMVFDLVPSIEVPQSGLVNNGYDFLMRAIRDRRVDLRELGLEERTDATLAILSESLPALPPASSFEAIEVDQNPEDAPAGAKSWGPENEGLRAAALMPAEIARGDTAEARLFIKNVSLEPIFLTVSDRQGYDTASAVDALGTPLKIDNELVHPMGYAGVIRPETDPGLTAMRPALANLVRLELKPGAIWELKTKTALHFFESDESRPARKFLGEEVKGQPSIATLFSDDPTEALITWELHTANGAEYGEDLRSRIWPAKGGWSGLLHTAPIRVRLVEER